MIWTSTWLDLILTLLSVHFNSFAFHLNLGLTASSHCLYTSLFPQTVAMTSFLSPQTPPAFSNTVGGGAPASSAPLSSPTPMTTMVPSQDQQPGLHDYSTAFQSSSCPQEDMNDFMQDEMETNGHGTFQWDTYDEHRLHGVGHEVQQEQQILTGQDLLPDPYNSTTYAQFPPASSFNQHQGQDQGLWPLQQQQQQHFPPRPYIQPEQPPPFSMCDHNQFAFSYNAPYGVEDPSQLSSHTHAQAWAPSQPQPQFHPQFQPQFQSQSQAQAAQFCILASAARKAEMEVMVRDMGEVGLM